MKSTNLEFLLELLYSFFAQNGRYSWNLKNRNIPFLQLYSLVVSVQNLQRDRRKSNALHWKTKVKYILEISHTYLINLRPSINMSMKISHKEMHNLYATSKNEFASNMGKLCYRFVFIRMCVCIENVLCIFRGQKQSRSFCVLSSISYLVLCEINYHLHELRYPRTKWWSRLEIIKSTGFLPRLITCGSPAFLIYASHPNHSYTNPNWYTQNRSRNTPYKYRRRGWE